MVMCANEAANGHGKFRSCHVSPWGRVESEGLSMFGRLSFGRVSVESNDKPKAFISFELDIQRSGQITPLPPTIPKVDT